MIRLLRKKWKSAIAITGMLIVLLGAVAIVYRRVHTRRVYAGLKAEGIAASQSGNHRVAVRDLRSYLSAYFNDQAALRAYIHSRPLVNVPGDHLHASQDTILALHQLIRLESDSIADRHALIKLHQSLGQDTESVDAADELLALAPGDVVALGARATGLAQLKKWNDALDAARKWCEADPSDVDAQMALFVSMHELKKPPAELLARAMQLRKSHPDSRSAFLVGFVLSLSGQSEKAPLAEGKDARAWFAKSAAESPSDARLVKALAVQLDRMGAYDDSLALLRKADSAAGPPAVRRQLLRRLWQLGAWPEVVSRCTALHEIADAEVSGIYSIALEKTGEQTRARRERTLLADRHDDVLAGAWVAIFDNATGAGDIRELIAACVAALEEDAGDAPLHFICGNSCLAVGNTLGAVREMDNAAACSLSWALPLARAAEVHVQRGEIDAAIAAAQEALRRTSRGEVIQDPTVAIDGARVLFAAKEVGRSINVAGLSRLIDAVQRAMPGEPNTLEIQTTLLAEAGQVEEAKTILKRLIESSTPTSEETLLRLASVSRAAHLGLEDACYQRSEHDHGLTPALAFEKASALLRNREQAQGWKLLNDSRARGVHPDASGWEIALCSYLQLAGDPSAVAAWKTLGDRMPGDPAVQRVVLNSPAAASDRAFEDRTIQRLRKLTGENALEWRLARARELLIDPKSSAEELNEADRIVQDILQSNPDSAEAHWLQGGLFERRKNTVDATREFRAAADLDPTASRYALELLPLLKASGDTNEIKQRLRCVADGPNPTADALMQLAWLYEKSDQSEEAELCYRRALKLQPDLTPAQNNLAMLLSRSGRPTAVKEAVAIASAAARQYPRNANLLDTLAHTYQASGDLPAALDSISNAIALSPDNLDFRLTQIEWLIDSGRRDAAKTSLKAVDRLKIDTTQIGDALRFRLSSARQTLK